MARRETIWTHLRWDALALIVVVFLVGAYHLIQQPRLELAESPQSSGSRPPDRTEGDVLLVLPAGPAATAQTFDALDCSYSWFNALWHHYGAFATATADTLSPQLLAGRAVVVVPGRVAREMPPQGRELLEDFARSGGQLLVELPREGWETITGVATGSTPGQARQITAVEGLRVYGPMREHLPDVPLSGQLLPTADLEFRPTGPVVFTVEEQPGYLIQPLGRGHVHTLLFDAGCSLTAMHQGRPTREMTFGPPGSDPWLPTSARVAHERLLTSHVPYADLLQKALFGRLSEHRPLPRLWPFPGESRGALMTVHPAEEMSRAALGYADWARRAEASSTIFAAADRFTAHHAGLADQVNAELGLLWVLGQTRPPMTESVGVGALQPWSRELNLPRQQTLLSQTVGADGPLRLVRTEASLFETDWASTFRTLAGAGLRVDVSFGPSMASQYGYLFGTGMPYYPLDERGLLFPIIEVPYVLDGPGLSISRLTRMLGNSRSAFHQPLVVSLPADTMARDPAAGTLLGFRQLHELGREYEHWLTTVGDFTDFLAARRQSVLTSQWDPREGRLTISVNLLGLRLSTAPDGAVPSVAIPARFDGRDIERVEVDGESLRLASLPTTGPGDERLLTLPPGRHVISVFYEASEDDDDGGEDNAGDD